ncbi:neuroendocrine convertase 1 [Trichonephila inaurata madagascariensis]|uniref:Neuroendocrine convertase 1 n=1 Tax=Trichonephila inaurata madagascariensis TaxID=2747483 RepID=A0A8X6MCU1_9ARAC|nr:neuroendocrine convertase 1 [Trichonephila inaurata madagascariensis]
MKFVSPIIVCYTGNKEISASDIRHYHDLVDMNAVRVKWVALQTPLTRVKRTVFGELRLIDIYRTTFKAREKKNSREKVLEKFRNTSLINFNDPLFGEQWYLLNKGQTGSAPDNDINVLPVWKSGITGKGVRISVLDDGIHPQSEEVAQNYDSTSSEDLSFKKSNYNPIPENSHGTYCAAIAAGVANNNVCGVGVAYDAKIGDEWLGKRIRSCISDACQIQTVENFIRCTNYRRSRNRCSGGDGLNSRPGTCGYLHGLLGTQR